MQPYIPQSNALPGPSPLSRPGGDASLQSLLGFMSQHASSNSQEGHGAEGEPIRPEAVRMLSQTLGGSGQGAGAQQMLANLAGAPLGPSTRPALGGRRCLGRGHACMHAWTSAGGSSRPLTPTVQRRLLRALPAIQAVTVDCPVQVWGHAEHATCGPCCCHQATIDAGLRTPGPL